MGWLTSSGAKESNEEREQKAVKLENQKLNGVWQEREWEAGSLLLRVWKAAGKGLFIVSTGAER